MLKNGSAFTPKLLSLLAQSVSVPSISSVSAMLLFATVLPSCGKAPQPPSHTSAPATTEAQQIPQVDVFTAQYADVPKTIELEGRVVAYQTAEVRPQVTGILQKKLFIEGSFVQQEQPLFQVDAQSYEKAVANNAASLSRHAANLKSLVVKRQGLLQNTSVPLSGKALSSKQKKQRLAELNAQIELAKADITLAKSLLDTSQLALARTVVRSPITGQTSLSDVASGSFVSINQEKPLVYVYQLDPIYVDMQQPVQNMREKARQITDGILNNLSAGESVRLSFSDGEKYPEKGRITFSSSNINSDTDTMKNAAVRVRAVFNNEDRQLLPGMAVKASVRHGDYHHAFVLPVSAVISPEDLQKSAKTTTQKSSNPQAETPQLKNQQLQNKQPKNKKTKKQTVAVFVVNKQNLLEKKLLTVQGRQGTDGAYIVTAGVKDGDVIVKNAENLSANMLVKPIKETAKHTRVKTKQESTAEQPTAESWYDHETDEATMPSQPEKPTAGTPPQSSEGFTMM